MATAISSRYALREWLENKPRAWKRIIALRAALRVSPLAIDPANSDNEKLDQNLPLSIFRAIAVSMARTRYSFYPTSGLAARNASLALNVTRKNAAFAVFKATAATAVTSTAAAAAATTAAAAAAAQYGFEAALWSAVSDDCDALEGGQAQKILLAAPLWSDTPEAFREVWEWVSVSLTLSGIGFGVWDDWYARRLRGEGFAFAGFDEATEIEFSKRLFTQDDPWWKRSPAAVNADIADWVAELARPEETPPDEIAATSDIDFFISYSVANEAAAREVAAILDDLGKTYLVQYRDFAQQNFVNAMNEAMVRADRMIALYSPDYMASDHCNAEWNFYYNRDPSSAQRRIVAFKLEDADLKPLMNQIVYRDLSRLTGSARTAAYHDWIIWEPPTPSRAQVEQVVTATLSPRIVQNDQGKLDTQPNPVFDQPEYPAELAEALKALRMVLDVVLESTGNLARPMQKALAGYNQEFTANAAKSSWGGLDRIMAIIVGGLTRMPDGEFTDGQKEALEQLLAAHGDCLAALKNADKQMRELATVPLDGADQVAVGELIEQLKVFSDRLAELDLTSQPLDAHVATLVAQGRDFTFEAGEPDDKKRPPHARRKYLLYVGGFGLAALNALGSMASISSVALGQQAVAAGRMLVESFFRMIGL